MYGIERPQLIPGPNGPIFMSVPPRQMLNMMPPEAMVYYINPDEINNWSQTEQQSNYNPKFNRYQNSPRMMQEKVTQQVLPPKKN